MDNNQLRGPFIAGKLQLSFGIIDPSSFLYSTRRDRVWRWLVEINLDRVCKAAFPIAFLVFNFVYWGYYLP